MFGLKRIITKNNYLENPMLAWWWLVWFNCSWSQALSNNLQHKTINLGIGGDRIKNVLWRINNIVLPKSISSVVIHCSAKNIDTSSSDEISVGVVTIARSISHRYPNIEIIVSSLLPRDIHWSTRRVKINETNDYLRDYYIKFKKLTFMR